MVVIDSIQTMFHEDISSDRQCFTGKRTTNVLMQIAKGQGVSIFIVGHVTKEGNVAGPRVFEHMVDTVLYFEGDRHASYRILRAVKNRFGSTNEIGVFLRNTGLEEVINPSEFMLKWKTKRDIRFNRGMFYGRQCGRFLLKFRRWCTSQSNFGIPRRTAVGTDFNRVNLLMAVLEKSRNPSCFMCAYVNIAGGMKIRTCD